MAFIAAWRCFAADISAPTGLAMTTPNPAAKIVTLKARNIRFMANFPNLFLFDSRLVPA
jgi:hypothetical protein|tara:strand:+ start:528 stop:704 length:177 start_codon:yes stop_codon:yes gene_type:complete